MSLLIAILGEQGAALVIVCIIVGLCGAFVTGCFMVASMPSQPASVTAQPAAPVVQLSLNELIKLEHGNGATQSELAKRYGISQGRVSQIVKR